MHSMMQAVSRTALSVADFLTPVLKNSKFKETGVITPDEFVASGDFLVYHCPTWQWVGGDPSKRKSYLPADKQFLMTRNVPCYRRVSQLLSNHNPIEVLVEPEDPDGGWVDTYHGDDQSSTLAEKASEMTLKDNKNLPKSTNDESNIPTNPIHIEDDDDDEDDEGEEAVDMAAFMKGECKIDEDDLIAPAPSKPSALNSGATARQLSSSGGPTDILSSRTYDLHITYDKYYQTSRMWLCGYDEDGTLLTETQMFDDFSQDHVKKTVTMETHPHLPGGSIVVAPPNNTTTAGGVTGVVSSNNNVGGATGGVTMASIHPCRQAEVMKKLIEAVAEGGASLGVHQYILIFLKFVQAVIPTIEYDYTRNFNM